MYENIRVPPWGPYSVLFQAGHFNLFNISVTDFVAYMVESSPSCRASLKSFYLFYLSFLAGFQTAEAYSNLGHTKLK